jgi:hypothetical protein
MELHSLPRRGDISPEEFRELFAARLGERFETVRAIFGMLGPMHSHAIANLIHLGLQKRNVEEVVKALMRWGELFPKAPDPMTAHVDTRHYLDLMMEEFFINGEDTINGVGPFSFYEENGQRFAQPELFGNPKSLWTPHTS